jgi:hypothetical protein
MINWKTCIGLSLLMIAAIEFLKIKDHYHPDRITPSLVVLMIAFVLSVAISTFLILCGLKGLKRKFARSRH